MISINLYMPGKLNCNIQLPNQWDELETPEIIQLCKQQLADEASQPIEKASLLLFIISYRAKQQRLALPKNWRTLIDAEQFTIDGLPLLEFLFAKNELTKQPLTTIKLPGWFGKKMIGPADGFSSITCGEFEDAELHFNQFMDNPDSLPLANLAAILWRKKDTPYILAINNQEIKYPYEKLVPIFQKLQPAILYAVFVWYLGCRSQLPKYFPTIHNSQGSTKSGVDLMAFTKCIHAGAGVKNGTRLQIRMQKLLEFMFDMEQESIHAEELRQEYEQQK